MLFTYIFTFVPFDELHSWVSGMMANQASITEERDVRSEAISESPIGRHMGEIIAATQINFKYGDRVWSSSDQRRHNLPSCFASRAQEQRVRPPGHTGLVWALKQTEFFDIDHTQDLRHNGSNLTNATNFNVRGKNLQRITLKNVIKSPSSINVWLVLSRSRARVR